LPNILPQPPIRPGAFRLRPPVLPPQAWARPARPVYSEEEMERIRSRAERTGEEKARASWSEERSRNEAEKRRVIAHCLTLAHEIESARRSLLEEAAEKTCDLAFAVAARVLRREAAADPAAVVPQVRELLQRAAAADSLTLRLSSRDHALLTSHPELLPEANGLTGLRLRADSSVADGGCLLETEAGGLDARLETQLEILQTAVRESGEEA